MNKKAELIKRSVALTIIHKRLEKEEEKLKEAQTEYRKRVLSRSIAILRDLYHMVENVDTYYMEVPPKF